MSDRFRLTAPAISSDPTQVRHQLASLVNRILTEQNGHGSDARVVRASLPVEDVDPFQWLSLQGDGSKLYWQGREEKAAIAAVGVADVCAAQATAGDPFGVLERQLQGLLSGADAGVRYYGGLRFDPGQAGSDAWTTFGVYRFVLPRFELRLAETGAAQLACNLVLPRDRARRPEILAQIHELALPDAPLVGALPLPLGRADYPEEPGWNENVAWGLDAFVRGDLRKVVLARKAVFTFAERLNPLLLLEKLQTATPHCFHFGFSPRPGLAFVGASPERLFRLEGRRLVSEAVAGTRPRGDSATADARLRDELLASEKDHREHWYVQQSIRDTFASLCVRIAAESQTSEMRLARGRHLYSRIEGALKDGVSSLDVLRQMHPTPAVGGYPTEPAMRAIGRLEPFDRGWYAGPVGWVGPEAAEFAVGIRSALVQDNCLALFSGAGIVEGSTPEGEWEEIEHKIGDFISVLGLDVRRAK